MLVLLEELDVERPDACRRRLVDDGILVVIFSSGLTRPGAEAVEAVIVKFGL